MPLLSTVVAPPSSSATLPPHFDQPSFSPMASSPPQQRAPSPTSPTSPTSPQSHQSPRTQTPAAAKEQKADSGGVFNYIGSLLKSLSSSDVTSPSSTTPPTSPAPPPRDMPSESDWQAAYHSPAHTKPKARSASTGSPGGGGGGQQGGTNSSSSSNSSSSMTSPSHHAQHHHSSPSSSSSSSTPSALPPATSPPSASTSTSSSSRNDPRDLESQLRSQFKGVLPFFRVWELKMEEMDAEAPTMGRGTPPRPNQYHFKREMAATRMFLKDYSKRRGLGRGNGRPVTVSEVEVDITSLHKRVRSQSATNATPEEREAAAKARATTLKTQGMMPAKVNERRRAGSLGALTATSPPSAGFVAPNAATPRATR